MRFATLVFCCLAAFAAFADEKGADRLQILVRSAVDPFPEFVGTEARAGHSLPVEK